jgi:pilus assembly protein CpaD
VTNRISIEDNGALRLMGALLGLSVALGACTSTSGDVVTATVPEDYRQRHPIVVEEGKQSIVVFVGHGRGGLSPSQRADVMGLARSWMREGTGAIVVDVPVDTPNARAAASAFQEIRDVLAGGGVPPRGITQHRYRPDDPEFFAAVRLSYPRIKAVAGPCGEWPADLGPSIRDPDYFENRPHYNFGCAMQRNLAAVIDNPADLEQPRSESYAYTARRTAAFEKYRKGEPTSTTYPEADKAKLSDTGK